jgi:hypothetical protein
LRSTNHLQGQKEDRVSILPSDGISPFDQPLIKGLEAHIYVLGFESGLVKVGYSASPDKRIALHERHGAAYGNPLAQSWRSGPHVGAFQNEALLIKFCAEHATVSSGREYFTDIAFDEVRAYATTLQFARGDKEAHEQQQRALYERLYRQMSMPQDRLFALPQAITFPEPQIDGRQEALLAELFNISIDEVQNLTPELHARIKTHLERFVSLKQDAAVFEGLLGRTNDQIRACLTDDLSNLRNEIRPALPGAHIVQFPTGTAGGDLA